MWCEVRGGGWTHCCVREETIRYFIIIVGKSYISIFFNIKLILHIYEGNYKINETLYQKNVVIREAFHEKKRFGL